MRIYLLYNRQTPGERQVQDIARELEREPVEVELMDADSARGVQLVENYDVMGRPAIMLVREDGSPVQIWQNSEQFPTARELGYLAHS